MASYIASYKNNSYCDFQTDQQFKYSIIQDILLKILRCIKNNLLNNDFFLL